MKRFLKTLMLATAMLACVTTASAQQKTDNPRPSREELAARQANYIADQMAFDDATTTRFVKTYTDCQKEVWALGPRHNADRKKDNKAKTDAETEQELKEQFDHSQKLLDIRQKYYKEYSKFLTQKQIKRVYELERNMMKRLGNQKAPRRNAPRPQQKQNEK